MIGSLKCWCFCDWLIKMCVFLWLADLNVCVFGHLRKVFRSWVSSPVPPNFPVALDPYSQEKRLPLTSHLSWHVPPLRQGLLSQHPFWQSSEGASDWKNSKKITRNLREKMPVSLATFISITCPSTIVFILLEILRRQLQRQGNKPAQFCIITNYFVILTSYTYCTIWAKCPSGLAWRI